MTPLLLAQAQLDSVPATYLKWFMVVLCVLIVMVGVVVGIIKALQKPEPNRIVDEPPIKVEKSPKRFNHDLFVSQHQDVTRRLDGHDKEFEELWRTLRAEDAETRRQMAESFLSIQRALGRIEGKLDKE